MGRQLSHWWRAIGGTPSLRNRILTDPYYRFANLTEVALAASLGVKIDVNRAGIDEWLRLPGLSIHQARSLVQLSQTGVQFYSLEDLAAALGLPLQRLQPLGAILQFCYYPPELTAKLDPNTATVEDLLTLPGVDGALAHQWVRDRLATGRFQNLAQLQQRLHLSGQQIEQLLHLLKF